MFVGPEEEEKFMDPFEGSPFSFSELCCPGLDCSSRSLTGSCYCWSPDLYSGRQVSFRHQFLSFFFLQLLLEHWLPWLTWHSSKKSEGEEVATLRLEEQGTRKHS